MAIKTIVQPPPKPYTIEHYTCCACEEKFQKKIPNKIGNKIPSFLLEKIFPRKTCLEKESEIACPSCGKKDYKKTFFDSMKDSLKNGGVIVHI